MKQIKPNALKPGNRIAAVTLSWGGPGQFPHRYEAGKRQFEEMFDLHLVEMEHTCSDPDWIYQNPKARAEDLMAAFKDDTIHGVISTIGGDDSIRMLPYLDLDIFKDYPKVFVGYSDTTVTHLALFKAGLVSFYGPAIMVGLAENGGIHPYLESSFRNLLFQNEPAGVIPQNVHGWTVEHLDWNLPANQEKKRDLSPCSGWNFIQGKGSIKDISSAAVLKCWNF